MTEPGERISMDIEEALSKSDVDFQIHVVEEIGQGLNTLYRVTGDGREYDSLILKQYTYYEDSRYATKEFKIYTTLNQESSLPVPDVLGLGTGGTDQCPWILMEAVSGESYNSETIAETDVDLPATVEQAGRYLGQLHANFSFEEFGRFDASAQGLQSDGFYASWVDQFVALVDRAVSGIGDTRFDDSVSQAHTAIQDNKQLVRGDHTPVLVHQDYRFGNFVLDTNRRSEPVNGVIDWELASIGHYEYELALAEYHLIDRLPKQAGPSEELRDALYEGYENHGDRPSSGDWSLRRSLYRIVGILFLIRGFEDIWGHRPPSDQNAIATSLIQDLDAARSNLQQ